MNPGDFIVFIVDDDARMREALSELLESLGWRAIAFGSAGEYIAYPRPDLPACLILDVELPDINGLDFQKQISQGDHPPIVFLTGHGDIPSSVRAIKHGAVDFLTKPFTERDLLDAIQSAVERDRRARQDRAELESLQLRFARLTPREREVVPLVVSGLLNKQAAAELGISEVTLQIHRGKIMQKMEAASLADLVRIAERLQVTITHSRRAGSTRTLIQKRVIAIVDDDPRLLESLGELLESAGYSVQSFSSARSFLEKESTLRETDFLIADIGMPGIDGFELERRVKQARPELPVVLITGRHEIADQQRAIAQGNRFFRKPFDSQALLAAIGQALRNVNRGE